MKDFQDIVKEKGHWLNHKNYSILQEFEIWVSYDLSMKKSSGGSLNSEASRRSQDQFRREKCLGNLIIKDQPNNSQMNNNTLK